MGWSRAHRPRAPTVQSGPLRPQAGAREGGGTRGHPVPCQWEPGGREWAQVGMKLNGAGPEAD